MNIGYIYWMPSTYIPEEGWPRTRFDVSCVDNIHYCNCSIMFFLEKVFDIYLLMIDLIDLINDSRQHMLSF